MHTLERARSNLKIWTSDKLPTQFNSGVIKQRSHLQGSSCLPWTAWPLKIGPLAVPKRRQTTTKTCRVRSQNSDGLINNIFKVSTLQHIHFSRYDSVTQTDVHSIWRLYINCIAYKEYQRNTGNWLGVTAEPARKLCRMDLETRLFWWPMFGPATEMAKIWQSELLFLLGISFPWYVVVSIQTYYLHSIVNTNTCTTLTSLVSWLSSTALARTRTLGRSSSITRYKQHEMLPHHHS